MSPELIDGKYEIVRQLGEGGMGAVYEARNRGTGRRVAIKVIIGEALAKSPGLVDRFQREARATGAIETQHIAHVLDTGTDAATGHPYMVMEFLSGEDVGQLVHRVGPVPPDVALRIIAQACIGLAKAHEAGVVHRDLKPANLYLARRDGGEVIVKVLDFGIAKVMMDELGPGAMRSDLTATGAMLGTPLYMSPEQAQGAKNVDHRTDLWSLGVVLYELLSGRTPNGHLDTLGGLILAICSRPAQLVQEHAPWVPVEVAAIVHKSIAIDPAARFQTANEMLEAVNALLPSGNALRESLLAELPPDARSVVAPRLAVTAPDPRSSPVALAATVAAPAGDAASAPTRTTAGVSGTRAPTETPRRASWPFVAGALAIVALGGAAIYGASRRSANESPGTASAPATTSAPVVVTPSVPSTTATVAATSSVQAERTVSLAIVPANASVEIDGTAAAIANGVVLLKGALGSKHTVRVSLAKRETSVDVFVTESGAVPPRIDLAPAAPSARANVAGPASGAPAGQPAGAPTIKSAFQ